MTVHCQQCTVGVSRQHVDARRQHHSVRWRTEVVKLGVVCVEVHFETQVFHECCNISCVQYVQQRTEDWTLRNSRSHAPSEEEKSHHRSVQHRCVQWRRMWAYRVICRTVPFCVALFCNVLYCSVLHCTVLYRAVLYRAAPYCTLLYCNILSYSCSVQNFTTCTVLIVPCGVVSCRILYLTVLCCTILCCANCNFLLTYCTHSSVFSVVLSRLALHCNGMNNKVPVPCTQLIIMCWLNSNASSKHFLST